MRSQELIVFASFLVYFPVIFYSSFSGAVIQIR